MLSGVVNPIWQLCLPQSPEPKHASVDPSRYPKCDSYLGDLRRGHIYTCHKSFILNHTPWMTSSSLLNPHRRTKVIENDLGLLLLVITGQLNLIYMNYNGLSLPHSRLKKIKCLQPYPDSKCDACSQAKVSCRFRDRERYFVERSRAIAGPTTRASVSDIPSHLNGRLSGSPHDNFPNLLDNQSLKTFTTHHAEGRDASYPGRSPLMHTHCAT